MSRLIKDYFIPILKSFVKGKDFFFLILKGIIIGAAEVVPGVSGATMAFISGIYSKIVDSVNKLNFSSLKILFKKGFKAFWAEINGSFMLSLSIGIIFSLVTFVQLFSYLFNEFPIFITSFFFGVIFASIFYIFKDFRIWNYKVILAILIGIGLSAIFNVLTPLGMSKESEYWVVVACGFITALAIFLPGISAAIVLIMLGQYEFISKAFSSSRTDYILIYIAACLIGFFIISKFISIIIKKYQNISLSFLSGLMIGSLFKLWPWKHTLLQHTNQYAQIIPVKQENVLPNSFFELTAKDPQTLYAILMAITGFLVIYLLHNAFSKSKQEVDL